LRQFVAICGIVAIFMYAGFTLQEDRPTSTVPRKPEPAEIATTSAGRQPKGFAQLSAVMEAVGAATDEVVLTGWVEVANTKARQQLMAALRWSGATPAGEVREAVIRQREGRQVLSVRWVMKQPAVSVWEPRAKALKETLAGVGSGPQVTVQLSGRAEVTDLPVAARKGLDAVNATQRQPWSDKRSASLAGRSEGLPESPFGINVQIAVRADTAGGKARVWVAWPALLQEY